MQASSHQADDVEEADVARESVEAADARLKAEFERESRGAPDAPSNFDASVDQLIAERNFTKKCKACKGSGARDPSPAAVARYERKISKQKDPAARANLRERMRRDSVCQACTGTGRKEAVRRKKGVQLALCDDCRGLGCRTCYFDGVVFLGIAGKFDTTVCCPRCKGSGEVFNEDLQDVCPLCKGQAWTVPITVRSTGSTKHGAAPEFAAVAPERGGTSGAVLIPTPAQARRWREENASDHDEDIMDAFGRFAAERPELARVLADYRGTVGNRWGHGHRWGRLFVVWPHTIAGDVLVRDAPERLRRELGARPLELLAAIRHGEERSSTPHIPTRVLLTRADEEARLLLREAQEAFAEVAGA